ncbi:hypothetical protein QL285_039219 [Trifolium repens]|nr:hypothetical protein QL285_039219 [Trifolium repens]
MVVVSFNIRGMGSRVKKRKLKELDGVEMVDFLAIQETKLEVVTNSVCYSLWGNNDCDWVSCPTVGNSGGIFSIWRKSIVSLVFSIVGDGFVGVCFDLFVKQIRVCVINVYSKCHLADKRRL